MSHQVVGLVGWLVSLVVGWFRWLVGWWLVGGWLVGCWLVGGWLVGWLVGLVWLCVKLVGWFSLGWFYRLVMCNNHDASGWFAYDA